MLLRIKLTSFIILLSFCSLGQTYNSIDKKVKHKIDSTYNSLITKNKIIGTSIALVQNDQIIYATGYGFQDKENEIKADENTIYRIGSCTKSFSALATMQLQDQNKIALTDPIQKYLTDLKIKSRFSKTNDIRIQDILNHTSGLPSDILNGFFCDNPPSIEWLIQQLNNSTMAAPAGYQHSYSNVGYSLIGELIKRVSGKSYEDYLEENIFKTMEMNSSFVSDPENNFKYPISKGYLKEKEYDEIQIRDKAAGFIHSSALDMGNYLRMYLAQGNFNGRTVVSENAVQEMQKNGLTNLILPNSKSWGYGLYSDPLIAVNDKDSTPVNVIGHGGDTWAFHADFKYIPELNIGAVVLTNSSGGNRMNNAYKLIKLYLKESENIHFKREEQEPSLVDRQEKTASKESIIGRYSVSGINLNISNPDKIKMKQGPAKIVLKPVNDSLRYAGKVKLFGIIPIKIKHQEYRFVEYNDAVYFKVIHTSSNKEDFAAIKAIDKEIPENWLNKVGKYSVTGNNYTCNDCPYLNFKDYTLELFIKDDQLIAKFEGTTKDTKTQFALDIIDNTNAVTPGIGRGTGDNVIVLSNGNIFYSGFEFAKTE